MKELTRILAAADRLGRRGQPFALATVVKLDGPGYRRPGARMLVAGDGQTTGAISGGCLEGEVAQHALRVLEAGTPEVVALNVDADDPVLGFGTGCDGVVYVLIEPMPPEDRADPVALLRTCEEQRQSGLLATLIDADGSLPGALGRRVLVTEDGPVHVGLQDTALREAIVRDAAAALEEGRSRIHIYPLETGTAEVLHEVIHPTLRLVLFGDGHDVGPVVRLGALLGWDVTVVGGRPEEELKTRFPEADAWVFLMHPEEVRSRVALDAWSAAVVMSHNYVRDRTILEALLPSPASYLGALGPRRRTQRMLDDLRSAGTPLKAEQTARIYGPVGLDIGTETPEEIALSIVAEIQAVLSGRSGGMLKGRSASIHEEVPIS